MWLLGSAASWSDAEAPLTLVLQGGKASGGLSCSGLQRLVVVMLQLSRDPAAELLAGPIEVCWQQSRIPP